MYSLFEKLTESVPLLDSAFRSGPAIFSIAEARRDGATVYISPNLEHILGHTPAQFLASASFWRDHLHPEETAQVLAQMQHIAERGKLILEYRFLDAHNTYRRLRDEIEWVQPDGGTSAYLQRYWHDIGEAQAQEAARQESRSDLQRKAQNLQLIIDCLPQRLLWKDRHSVFRGCNRAAADELGLAHTEDIVGKTELDLHANKMEADYLRLQDEAVMDSGQPSYHAGVPAHQEGVWLDVTKVPLHNLTGAIDGLLISYEDVSEAKLNKLALERFRSAVEQSSSAIIITDQRSNIVYVNTGFKKLYGYSGQEVLGKNPRILSSGLVDEKLFRTMWETLRRGQAWHGELSNCTKGGEIRTVDFSISPVFDDHGACVNYLAIEEDITARKELENSLQRQLEFTQTLINALPHPVYYKNRDGVYLGCNRAFEEAMGLGQNGIRGKRVFDIAPPDIARIYLEKDNELFAHPGIQSYETKMPHRDGTLHDILSHKATYTDSNGAVIGIIGSTFDISERKRMEQWLRESEERFRTIANYSYSWENWIDPNGKLLWVNPAVERVTGYTQNECLAMENFPAPLIHPDDMAATITHYAASLAGASYRPLEFRLIRKDGDIRWVEVFVEQVFDTDQINIGHRSSVLDVTDRKRAMDELNDVKNMLQMVLDHIPQGVFWKDKDGVYLGGNPVFARNVGLHAASETSGRTDAELFPAPEAEKFRRDDIKVMRRNGTLSLIDETFTDSDGLKHFVLTTKVPLHDAAGEVCGVLGTYSDLTELRQIDGELRDSEARLREITTTAAEGIYVMNENGIITFINPEAERLLGRSANDLVGLLGHSLFHEPGPNATDSCSILVATMSGNSYRNDDEYFYRKDGSNFNVSIRANPIIRDGEYAGAVVAFHDITEQIQTQHRLNDTLTKLQSINATLEQRVAEETQQNIEKERLLIQQSRSAAMGEMISNIAHQWRQPLSTLGLVVQNILLDYQENQLSQQELQKYVATAMDCVNRMSGTIDDFRNFFRPDKADSQFLLRHAVTESLRLLEASLKNSNIQTALYGDLDLQAFGHINEFSQVVLNILANAKDALITAKGPHPRIDIELRADDGHSQVIIRDNAGGIPDEAMPKMFDPYFTTKPGGTGIGLHMSKTIIEKHMNGSIVCRNVGEGAEFTISIPRTSNATTRQET